MEIIEINQTNLERLSEIIPPDVTENIGRLWYRGLFADDYSSDIPSGGIIWEYKNAGDDEKETDAEIVWAAGDDRETLEELLESYTNMIEEEATVRSKFELPLPREKEFIEEAFKEDGFELGKRESRDVSLTVQDLTGLKLAKKKPAFYIKPISELNFRQFRNGIIDVLFYERKGLMEDLAWVSMDWFEQDISSCVVMDDDVKGFFLVHKTTTGILFPVLLFAVDIDQNKTVLELLRFTVREVIKRYPSETEIVIRRHNSTVRALVQNLFPGKEGETVMTGARDEKTGGND
ncbi:MAG: hypothetical protein K6F99_10330 [Lachnospiraceae bacterium]|nr:hypothetical protein [Lachnospiraceae bacterium]